MNESLVTQATLHALFSYDTSTGYFTRKVHRPGRRGAAGVVAGCKNDRGYIRISIHGKTYAAHRLAWLYTFGVWPSGDIDHIDGDKTNNRLANLRNVSTSVNMQNQKTAQPRNSSKFLGVTKHGNRFEASIKLNGKNIYIGSYATPEAAHAAYLAKKRVIHEGCTI